MRLPSDTNVLTPHRHDARDAPTEKEGLMEDYHVSDALERLQEVTKTRRANGDPMKHDEFAALERERFVNWCAESPDHAEAVAWLADHLMWTIEVTALIRYGDDEGQDLIDTVFDSIARALP